ncbi:MAG TPA: helix-turn-helix transcriptional regulator [Thermoanaerobaculia bacterium]|nr:helix-turn-helix transcriptional regulator [Thermoanaerobaculia bacterium]
MERLLTVFRTAMRILGITNRDVEKKLGVSPSYLSRLFSGTIELKVEHVLELVAAIGLDPAEFFHLAYPRLPDPGSDSAQRLRQMLRDLQPPPSAEARPVVPTQEEIDQMLVKSLRKLLAEEGKAAAG